MPEQRPSEDLTTLSAEELEGRVVALRAEMRPLEAHLAELRGQRDVLATELRRRERLAQRQRRAGVKDSIRGGQLRTFAELVAEAGEGSLTGLRFHLRTGGEVRLGFPGAGRPTVAWTDGRQVRQAADLAQCATLYAAGWELGAPGRPGVRVHFPGTRQERLADPADIFVEALDEAAGG